jgi:hypothetical protein
MNENDIVFKTEDSMWQMLASSEKTWDARRWDIDDPRILRLCKGHWVRKYKDRTQNDKEWFFSERHVCFVNKATGELLKMRFEGLNFVDFAPGWVFLKLGEIVERSHVSQNVL